MANRDRRLKNRIRSLRELHNKSQEEFSTLLGIRQSTLSQVENGKRSVTEAMIVRLCVTLNCQPGDLLYIEK